MNSNSQNVHPKGWFAVFPSPNMKYSYQCSLDQQRSQKYLPIYFKFLAKNAKKKNNFNKENKQLQYTTRVSKSV